MEEATNCIKCTICFVQQKHTHCKPYLVNCEAFFLFLRSVILQKQAPVTGVTLNVTPVLPWPIPPPSRTHSSVPGIPGMHPVPDMGSCLGHIPGEATDKLSLWPWGVTWTATSTGWRPRRPGVTRSRGARHEGVVGGDEEDDGGGLLPRSLS